MKKKAVFVLGSYDYKAIRRGEAVLDSTLEILDEVSNGAGVDAVLVFATQDPLDAGKNKSKIGMRKLRAERPRVLDEIGDARPDFVMCFGPAATASVFDKGNIVQGNVMRQGHRPLGDDGPPVFVTFGMENVRYKAGLIKWLRLDVEAAVNGWTETEWGDYTILMLDDLAWHKAPSELQPTRGHGFTIPEVGYDLETYPGIDPWHPDARIRMAVISYKVGQAWVVQATPDSLFPRWVYDLIEDSRVLKSGSNIKFDYLWHRRFGHEMINMYDTSTHEHIIDESNSKKDLKSLTFLYVPKLGDYSKAQRDRVRELGGWENLTDAEMYQYAGGDGEASIGAYLGQKPLLAGLQRPAKLFRELYPVLADMEHNGACIDMAVNADLDTLYQAKLVELRQKVVEVLGPINIDSHQQLATALQKTVKDIKLTVREWKRLIGDDTDDPEISTKREILERESHKHPVIAAVLDYRSHRVRHSTFIKGIRDKYAVVHSGHTFIHPSFNTARVETYRLSSSRPNGQNIPRKDDDPALTVKRQFVSRFDGGEILEADQSQIEIRCAAWLADDRDMLSAISSGEDVHAAMAAIMLNKDVAEVTEQERQECKTRTFLILYGGGAKKLARDLGINVGRAQRMINEYFETFSGLKRFIEDTHVAVRKNLYVETPFGFVRRFVRPEHWDAPDGWTIQRQAFNTIVQNTAACITYCAMISLHDTMRRLRVKSKMILQAHDSIIIDVHPEEKRTIKDMMRIAMEAGAVGIAREEYGVNIAVPLKCEVSSGPSWGELS